MSRNVDIDMRLEENVQRKLNDIQEELSETSAALVGTAATAEAAEEHLDNLSFDDSHIDDVNEFKHALHTAKEEVRNLDREYEGVLDTVGELQQETEQSGVNLQRGLDDQERGGIELAPDGPRVPEDIERDFDTSGFGENLGDALNRLDRADDSLHQLTKRQQELGAVTELTEQEMQQEAEQFAEASVDAMSLAEMKEAATDSNRYLRQAAGLTDEALQEEAESMVEGTIASGRLEEQLDDLTTTAGTNAAALGMNASAVDKLAAAQTKAAATANRAEDEVEELDDEVEALGLSSLAASINIGPFNFALRQMSVQIPALLTGLGGLISSLGGVTVAALGAAGALGTVFAVGALQRGEQIAEQNEDIEGTLQGIEQLTQNFGEDLMANLEPLMNPTTLEMFQRFMNGILIAVNMTAQAFADVQDTLSGFQAAFGDAFFGNFDEIMTSLNDLMRDMLPIIADFFEFFFSKLPNAFEFFRKEGVRVLPMIASFGQQLIRTTKAFSDFGITVIKAVIPALNVFLRIITDIVQIINEIPALTEILTVGAFIVLFKKSVDLAKRLAKSIEKGAGMFDDMASSLASSVDDTGTIAENLDDAAKDAKTIEEAVKSYRGENGSQAGFQQETEEEGGLLNDFIGAGIVKIIQDRLGGIRGTIRTVISSLKAFATFVVRATRLLNPLTALLAILTALFVAFDDAVATGIERFKEILNIGQDSDGILADLGTTMDLLGDLFNAGSGAVNEFVQQISNVIGVGIIGTFEVLAGILDFLLNDILQLDVLVEVLEFIVEEFNDFLRGFIRGSKNLKDDITNTFDAMATGLENAINNRIIPAINSLIQKFNNALDNRLVRVAIATAVSSATGVPVTPGSIDKVDELEDVNFSNRDFGPMADNQAQPTQNDTPDVILEENTENNTTVNARPEDDQRIKRLVEQAITEANTFRRQRNARGG